MKIVGFVFITLGLALLLYVAFSYFKGKDQILSPLPDSKGVRVLFISPTK